MPVRALARLLLPTTLVALFTWLPACRSGNAGTTGCGDASCSATDTTTDTSTDVSTSGPDLCGNGMIDPGETCDDGQDCSDGVCNSDEYTGEKHCNAACAGLYPEWCGDKALQATETCDEGGHTPTCDADCTPAACGDGLLNPAAGEACDDGADNSDAYDDTAEQVGCNTSCTGKVPHCGDGVCQPSNEGGACGDCTCGDGIVSAPEACDDGMETAKCDADCTAAQCGDGYDNAAAGEECDDGNTVEDDACRNDCTRCGDGIAQAGEECDDGNTVDDDACSNECIKPRLVFVTSTLHNGNLGGLAGADTKCAAAGMAADPNLSATAWRAWLSDDTGSPSTRFDTAFTGWYRLVDGTPVAKGWSDLTNGILAAAINLTEAVSTPDEPLNAWSNTTFVGVKIGNEHCNNWTTPALAPKGRHGDTTATSTNWTDLNDVAINPTNCAATLHLYCFQDSP